MNKKLIKSITSKILWVALITLIIACEKDNMSETQVNVALENELQQIEPEITTQQLRFNDFPHKMQVKSYLHQIKENTTSTVLEHVSNSNTDDDFNPLTGLNIIQNQAEYTTYEGGHTYTFATYRNNDNGLIENIVLESQTDGSYNEYLMQYQLSDIEYQSLQEHNAYGFNLLDRTTLIPLENGSFNALVTNSVNCEKEAYTYSSTMIIGFCPCPEHQVSHQDGTCICEFAPRATVDYIGLKTKCSSGGGTTTVIGENPGTGTTPGDIPSGGNGNTGDSNNSGNIGNPDDGNDSGTEGAVSEIGGVTKPVKELTIAFPFFKYPLGADYASVYPNLTVLLSEYMDLLKTRENLINTIHNLTGVSTDDIIDDLTWGSGPIVEIQDLGTDTQGNEIKGKFNPMQNPNVIYLDIDLVNYLENLSNIANPTPQEQQQLNMLNGLIVYAVALHEYVHYADFAFDGTMQDNEDLELGELFEAEFVGGYYEFSTDGTIILIPAN